VFTITPDGASSSVDLVLSTTATASMNDIQALVQEEACAQGSLAADGDSFSVETISVQHIFPH
jgi:hypothetical protein